MKFKLILLIHIKLKINQVKMLLGFFTCTKSKIHLFFYMYYF